ncbi:MAG: hypothetical protein Tsb0016_12660 [Sphingomonadales bacterium]
MSSNFKIAFEALFGTKKGRLIAAQARGRAQDPRDRLQSLQDRFGDLDEGVDEEAPIFLLSSSWRSSSTILQRMVMANNPDILVWGEPYDHCNILDRMLGQISAFTATWPEDKYYLPIGKEYDLSNQWVANLYPEVKCFKQAHRAYFDTLFGSPAKAAGYTRWGIKEVRLNTAHACYLRWLYPNARFIFLRRNPLDAYRSYRQAREWFRTWPERPILTPYAFGRNWAELTQDFLAHAQDIGGLFVRYEDLGDVRMTRKIEDYLGWDIPPSSALAKIGSSTRQNSTRWMPKVERLLLKAGLGKAHRRAGYEF